MSDIVASSATYETRAEGQETPAAVVKLWMDALAQSDAEEKDWVKEGDEAYETYRGKKGRSKGRNFNILHSNVETLCPALYNSTPAPDVRRRFSDPDPVAKVVADILERSLSFSVDNYDFDAVMKAVIRDGEIPGRGVPRVRYVPTLRPMLDPQGQPVLDANQQPQEEVVCEEVIAEYVPWKYFKRGPARTWADVPWVAFGDLLTREQLRKLCGDIKDKNGELIADKVPLNYSAEVKNGARKPGVDESSIFARALVWQIWDKDSRKVISICLDYKDAPLATVEDPLALGGFFPVPRPYQPILATDSMVPIVPYEVYKDLVLELNDVTARIAKLIKQLRPRGLYGGNAADVVSASNADDGELVPATGIEQFMAGGGLDKAISWFPLDPTVQALKVLIEHRSEIKQVIYEVTGIADILRGSTNPNETLGAQQIKAQWGSLRVQDRQSEVARVARDVLRLKAEIIASKFAWETLSAMTGIDAPTAEQKKAAQDQIAAAQQAAAQAAQMAQMAPPAQGAEAGLPVEGALAPPQQPAAPQPPPIPEELKEVASQPSRDEIMALLRSDITRTYRTDIESDSTIRGDLARNQQVMTSFLQGTAQFAQAMGPIVMQFPAMLKPAMAVYSSFARQFKLGKQAEDALDKLGEAAEGEGLQKPPQPDPKLEAVKFEAGAKIEQTKMDMAFADKKHGIDMARLDKEMARDAQKAKLAPPTPQAQPPVDLPAWPYNPNAAAELPPEVAAQ